MYKQASRRYFAHELSFSEPAKLVNSIIGSLELKEPRALNHMDEETLYQYIQSQPITIEQRVESQIRVDETPGTRERGNANSVDRVKKMAFISGWSSLKLAAKFNIQFTPIIWKDSSKKSIELLAWSDLLRCFPLVDGKSYGRLFLLMKKYCPESVATTLLGGNKVTQQNLLKFLPCARNTLQLQINAEKEKMNSSIPKPQLINMDFEDS